MVCSEADQIVEGGGRGKESDQDHYFFEEARDQPCLGGYRQKDCPGE